MEIRKYYQLAQEINAQGGPGKVPGLYAQAAVLEDDILAQYGLPPSRRFVRILQSIYRHKKVTEDVLDGIVRRLETAATGYLMSSPLPDEQLLQQGKQRHRSAHDVLPEMGIRTHDYMVFVYNHYCTHRRIPPSQVVREFRLLREHRCLADVFHLKGKPHYRTDPAYVRLKSFGLQFVDAYCRAQQQTENDHKTHQEMKRELDQLLQVASASYLKYLQLRSTGIKDAAARKQVGLEDEVFYRIALYTFMLKKDS